MHAAGNRLQSRYLEYLPALFRREILVNTEMRKVSVAGEEVSLTDEEFDALAFLYERQGSVCTAYEIAEGLNLRVNGNGRADEEAVVHLMDSIRSRIEAEPRNPRYVKVVDGGYRFDTDEFMGRFLLIFESILDPIARVIDNGALYLDPLLAPEAFLPWLASWIGVSLDPRLPVERRRDVLQSSADLFRWRGTKKGLEACLRLAVGVEPKIDEGSPGMSLSSQTRLGENTVLGSAGEANHFTLTLIQESGREIDAGHVRAIIESQKPAHTSYSLNILQR